MSGRYLLDTNVAIRVLNQDVDMSPPPPFSTT